MIGWVLLVNDTLMAPDKPGYRLMLEVAPQHIWGVAMIVFGLSRVTVLFITAHGGAVQWRVPSRPRSRCSSGCKSH